METGNPTAPPGSMVVQGVGAIDPNTLVTAINEALRQQQGKEPPPPAETATQLNERFALLRRSHAFNVGDLVNWKPGLKNKRYPYDGQPAIVVEVLSTPILDPREPNVSPYFREPLDLVLGVIADDGSFATFYYDRRRFQPISSS